MTTHDRLVMAAVIYTFLLVIALNARWLVFRDLPDLHWLFAYAPSLVCGIVVAPFLVWAN